MNYKIRFRKCEIIQISYHGAIMSCALPKYFTIVMKTNYYTNYMYLIVRLVRATLICEKFSILLHLKQNTKNAGVLSKFFQVIINENV